MFTQAGIVLCEIDGIEFADARFAKGPSDFDVCIHGKSVDDPSQSDWWRGEISNNYGRGNFASMTQKEITFKTLRKLGFKGKDISAIRDQLMGKIVPYMIKETEKDGNTYFNVQYIGAGGGVEPISDDKAKARLKALMAETVDAPLPEPEPADEQVPDDEDLPF